MPKFFINNSSLEYLACSLRYKRIVVDGAVRPNTTKKELLAGTMFHDIMAKVSAECTAFTFQYISHPKHHDALPPELLTRSAMLGERIYREHPEMFTADTLREQYLEVPLPTTSADWEPVLCGTLDHLSLDTDGAVIITDYKTTAKPINSYLIDSYKLKSQPDFYKLLAYLSADKLPERFSSALKSWKLKFRYCFVNPSAGDGGEYLLMPPQFVDLDSLSLFRRLLNERIAYAALLHADPSLGVREGIFSNQCWRCEFQSLCAADTAIEAQRYESWPKKPYTAHHE